MFDESGIEQELEAYNPLIPDGGNLKATMLVEYEDENERREALARLRGIEDAVWVRVAGFPSVPAIADEDLDRENDTKTSAVHFVRFELTPSMIAAFRAGVTVAMGVDHPNYRAEVGAISPVVQDSLASDFS
jgi:hypothetical protein